MQLLPLDCFAPAATKTHALRPELNQQSAGRVFLSPFPAPRQTTSLRTEEAPERTALPAYHHKLSAASDKRHRRNSA